MKLLRLTTENENCVFDNVFNEDVIVKPFSKVCLQAFTTQLNKDILEINNQNNEIQFTLDGAEAGTNNWFIINLTNGIYDSSNIEVLLTDITNKLNLAMNGATPATLGKQWRAVLSGNRILIQCVRGECLTFNNNTIVSKYIRYQNATLQPLAGENYFMRTGGVDQDNDSFFYSLQPTNKGASSLRCQLRENPDPDNTGFVLGYVDANIGTKEDINTADISYGIKLVYDAAVLPDHLRYEVIYAGVVIPNDQMVNNPIPNIYGPADLSNDSLIIDITNNQTVKYSIYNFYENEYITLYEPVDFVSADNLFAVGVLIGDTQVFNFENTTDPFYIEPEKYIRYKKSHKTPNYSIEIPKGPYISDTYFSISSSELATSLGYAQNTFPLQPNLPAITYTAQDNVQLLANYPFFLKLNSDSYIVELLDNNLNSMDSMSNQRRNILAVIPQESSIVERVSFNASVLIWIDLNNKEPLNLRHIRARVLTEGLEPIFVYGLSQLVLLIE
jgi:hypothetical protein